MKWIVTTLVAVLSLGAIDASAEKVYRYRIFEPDNGKELGVQIVKVINKKEVLEISRAYKDPSKPGKIYQTLSVLAADLSTLRYVVKDDLDNSNYELTIKGGVLRFNGVFRGNNLKETRKIGKTPFYHDPSISLSRFSLSGEKKQVFQVINPDDQKLYEMVAIKNGEKEIKIGNQVVEAVEVKWTLTGFRSMFFEQIFWFRKSDGVFLAQEKASDNRKSELILE